LHAKSADMALREFEDAGGTTWRVWDTSPDIISGLTLEMQRGWLTFDNGTERRRLSPIPAAWVELPPERLRLLLSLAESLRPRQRTPTATPAERRVAERRAGERRHGDRRGSGETELPPT
jgi:hypothetical protein